MGLLFKSGKRGDLWALLMNQELKLDIYFHLFLHTINRMRRKKGQGYFCQQFPLVCFDY